jgi:hypothetical protein
MEIDLTQEASGHHVAQFVDRHRTWIVIAATLAIGLVAGGGLGTAYGKKVAGGGTVVLVNTELVGGVQKPTLHWSLANFAGSPGKVVSVAVDGKIVPMAQSTISGNTLIDFSTGLQCDSGNGPQITIVFADGDGVMQNFGYVVDKAEWKKVCKR